MIVATAGHIDHGKTLLVKALTGVDTDRLPEEKARGITIDIGFAYLPLASGDVLGFVDVPGHERFIRNMLAGVGGIDFALLVVAADDGVMPQTREHLQILDLLGIQRGALLITKSDKVDAKRLIDVQEQTRALAQHTSLHGAPLFAVSASSGQGIDALRGFLVDEAQKPAAPTRPGQRLRFAVDRAFTVQGSGTVVTGTVFHGSVQQGEHVVISPSGEAARVRGLQVHGQAVQQLHAGQRGAINLARVERSAVQRGDWVLAPQLHQPTQRLDVRFKLLASEAAALAHWSAVHVHLATGDVTARLALRGATQLAPGANALVHLVLDKPVAALRGDRIVVRDHSATRTLGGGVVIDPFAPATRRATAVRLAELAALENANPAAALAALAALSEQGPAIDMQRFALAYNLDEEHTQNLLQSCGLALLGQQAPRAITHMRVAQISAAAVATLQDFHRREPQAVGMDVQLLRKAIAANLSADVFAALLRRWVDGGALLASSSTVRLAHHESTHNSADEQLWLRLQPAIQKAGLIAPTVAELAAQLALPSKTLHDFLLRKARSGAVLRVTPERYFLRQTLADLAAAAQALVEAQTEPRFSAAQFRDATGVGRNHSIELLEFFDSMGFTQRVGDARQVRQPAQAVFGPGAAPPRPVRQAVAAPSVAPKPVAKNKRPNSPSSVPTPRWRMR